jgi:hypothetical protein
VQKQVTIFNQLVAMKSVMRQNYLFLNLVRQCQCLQRLKPLYLDWYWYSLVESYSINYVSVNYPVKYLTVDCKYLLFLHDFFFRLKSKQYKKCQCRWLFKKKTWKLIKQNKLSNYLTRNRQKINWRTRKTQLLSLCPTFYNLCDLDTYSNISNLQ